MRDGIRRGAFKVAGVCVAASVAAGSLASPDAASGAEWQPGVPTTIALPTPDDVVVLSRRARVQPQAWEFAPPYGEPDISPQSARTVEQLYEQLMRQRACLDDQGSTCR